ncbi:MAG TPA: ArgR family transcriptional regulator [Acidimicrobiales bacterium]|jgi:transcriptional regulator of arginine metabolism|nr:ArgR family transcriptional regulator [Acidimicrobiales bacterium]
MTKTQRQHRIAQILSSSTVTSQAQLVGILCADGILATQATVSRDLVELGVVKVRNSVGVRTLALPSAASALRAQPEHLRRVLSDWVVDVTSAGPLVVVKTPPGCAHVVASALDRGVIEGTLGTVAGDDTIFVVVDERMGGAAMAMKLRETAGLDAASSTVKGRTPRAAGTPSKRGR